MCICVYMLFLFIPVGLHIRLANEILFNPVKGSWCILTNLETKIANIFTVFIYLEVQGMRLSLGKGRLPSHIKVFCRSLMETCTTEK